MRAFEEALASLWRRGLISGEMHLGTGEEAAIAGVIAHAIKGDALALDHRPTPALVAAGVDMVSMLLEMLGSEKGLCHGMGGHMHLFSPEHLAASSGIVGSSAPIGAGFALAAKALRPGSVCVAFLGEGAMNQGMVLEAMNLASVWKLPLVLVCKDNHWSITTHSKSVTAGSLTDRARSLGMSVSDVNGLRAEKVCAVAAGAFERARKGAGPSFIRARCAHLEGHFLGDPLLRVFKDPAGQVKEISLPLMRAAVARGGGVRSRMVALGRVTGSLSAIGVDTYLPRNDPLKASGKGLDEETRSSLLADAREEVARAVGEALAQAGLEGGVCADA